MDLTILKIAEKFMSNFNLPKNSFNLFWVQNKLKEFLFYRYIDEYYLLELLYLIARYTYRSGMEV